jgi:hypothetical protein
LKKESKDYTPDAPPSPTPSVVKSDASTSIVSFLSIFASVLAFSL